MGRLTKNEKDFVSICKLTQGELKDRLGDALASVYDTVHVDDGFIYAKGELPVAVVAHMDTVHKVTCCQVSKRKVGDRYVLCSNQGIGGDDRCGIYIILKLLERGLRPHVIFTEDEEIGGAGADKFVLSEFIKEIEGCNYIVEFDRAHAKDAVFYNCDNPDFEEFIVNTTGYKTSYGTFSDISIIAPVAKVAAVNLSCGYYHAHTTKEEVCFKEMMNTVDVAEKLLKTESTQYEYIEYVYAYKYGKSGKYGGYSTVYDWFGDDGYDDYYYGNGGVKRTHIQYIDNDGTIVNDMYYGEDEDENLVQFFMDNKDICYARVIDYYTE